MPFIRARDPLMKIHLKFQLMVLLDIRQTKGKIISAVVLGLQSFGAVIGSFTVSGEFAAKLVQSLIVSTPQVISLAVGPSSLVGGRTGSVFRRSEMVWFSGVLNSAPVSPDSSFSRRQCSKNSMHSEHVFDTISDPFHAFYSHDFSLPIVE